MKNKNLKGDIQWFLTPESKKPFACSTRADSDGISVMLNEYGDLRIVLKNCPYLSTEQKRIIQVFINDGQYNPKIR